MKYLDLEAQINFPYKDFPNEPKKNGPNPHLGAQYKGDIMGCVMGWVVS